MNGASHIALALSEAMDASDSVHLLGEALPLSAVGSALLSKHPSRCHLLPAADATLVGVAVGLAIAGKTPVVELSGADALWGSIQQIGQEGGRLTGEFNGTVVIRVPVNEHPEQLVRLLDGVNVSVASPADPADAGALVTAALRHNGVTVLFEPTSVLHASGGQASEASLGKARTLETGSHITLAAWGSGVEATSAAARALGREGISAEVIDLRSLAPLDTETLAASVNKTGRLVLVGTGPHLLNAALDAAFLRLESPPAVVAPRTELITSKARAAVHY